MKLRTLIIDDEPIALEKLRAYVAKIPSLELSAACQSAFEAIDFLSANEVDLVVTDINMPDLDGLDFVRSLSKAPMVVFTTAYPQYAVDSYKVSAVDYLLKPYGFADFHRAVGKALELHSSRRQAPQAEQAPAAAPQAGGSLFVKVDYRYIRVSLADIRYIKGYGEYLQIYVSGSDNPLLTLSSFASIKERLTDNFVQVHRSYIVNMDHVGQIERNRVVMTPDLYIPVGDSFKAPFQAYLASHAVGRPK
ncbi:MAG: response regulator [Muribaculaceae bacterium]|nr:response regulator [Muribaculaceae bacterium]MDE7142037.1 response regulator [Muribaculaceae bacterium]